MDRKKIKDRYSGLELSMLFETYDNFMPKIRYLKTTDEYEFVLDCRYKIGREDWEFIDYTADEEFETIKLLRYFYNLSESFMKKVRREWKRKKFGRSDSKYVYLERNKYDNCGKNDRHDKKNNL